MPLKGNPVCIKCEAEESPLWTNAENLGAICLNCVNEVKEEIKSEPEDEEKEERGIKRKVRQTRSYKTRQNQNNTTAAPAKSVNQPKVRNRRNMVKKVPIKAPTAVSTPVTSESVYYKGAYFQIGDIVSLVDEDENIYYAQLRGFLTDQYCEKSAVITWLLPTQESPPPAECFDPATYILGPEEDVPRKLECMEFIMHAPSDYYKCVNSPYPLVHPSCQPGYIWTNLDPVKRLIQN